MILQIAVGVCLGIVFAAILLRYWRPILRVGLRLLVLVLLISPLIAVAVYAVIHMGLAAVMGIASAALAVVAMSYGAAQLVEVVEIKYSDSWVSDFERLLKGKAPWDMRKRQPLRFLVATVFVLAGATVIAGIFLGGAAFGSYVYVKLGGH